MPRLFLPDRYLLRMALGAGGSLTMYEGGGRSIPENGSALEGVDFRGRFVTKRVRGHGDPADGIPTSPEVLM